MTEGPFLTEEEAAAILRLAAGTLGNLRRAGKAPPHYTVGVRPVYDRDELMAWVRASRPVAEPEAVSA